MKKKIGINGYGETAHKGSLVDYSLATATIRVGDKSFSVKGRWEEGCFSLDRISPRLSDKLAKGLGFDTAEELKDEMEDKIQEEHEGYWN
jgi:hypothetical protein